MKSLINYITEYLIKKKLDKVRNNDSLVDIIIKTFGIKERFHNLTKESIKQWIKDYNIDESISIEKLGTFYSNKYSLENNPNIEKDRYIIDNEKINKCFYDMQYKGKLYCKSIYYRIHGNKEFIMLFDSKDRAYIFYLNK